MRPLSVLVADDVKEIRFLVRASLMKAGHTVTCAETGDEALKMLKEQPFDLLITDVIMPCGDGLGVLMEIKKANLPVRIIAISGGGKYFGSETCVRIAKGLGAHAALFKPFAPQALLEVIENVMAEAPVA